MVCPLPWPRSGSPPPLRPKEVHLWSASLISSDDKLRDFERCMDERELARANRYAMEISRTRFISARAMLKQLLAMYTGLEPAAVRFCLGPLGKPYLPPADGPALNFNSTDTQDEALFAFCLDAEIGVDIEFKNRQVNHPIIARRKFTPQELDQHLDCPAEQRKLHFLSLWTRKEAYGKAIGVGIKYRLNEVNLVDAENSARICVHDETGAEWEVAQAEPSDDLIACVVAQGRGWRYRCQRLSQDAL